MSALWTLEIAGKNQPIASWQLEAATLKLGSQICDQFVFTASDALKLAFGTAIALYFNSVCRFRGQVTQRSFEGSVGHQSRKYVASGPWWYLENTVYQQPRNILVDADDPKKGYTKAITTAAVLNQADDGSVRRHDPKVVQPGHAAECLSEQVDIRLANQVRRVREAKVLSHLPTDTQ